MRAVCFLWHCLAGCPGWVLPTALLCGARTFLGPLSRYATAWPTLLVPASLPGRPRMGRADGYCSDERAVRTRMAPLAGQ